MRARQILATTSLFTALLAATSAGAQPIDAERFKPAATHDGVVTVEGPDVRPTFDRWELGAFLNYAYHPLIVADANGDLVRTVVGGRLGVDALASVTVAGPFALGLDVPFFLAQSGDANPSFAGLGDVRLVPKLRIIEGTHGFGLALLAESRAPTHVGDFSGGARNVVFAPRLAMGFRSYGGFRLAANAGVALREKTTYFNVQAGSELTYALALGYRFGGNVGKVEIGAEGNGAVGFAAADTAELPLEALPYVKIYPARAWEITLGPGIGVIPGYGIPVVRAFAGVKYAPTTDDRDHDGVEDDKDKCPDQPETRNGVDDDDGCPDEERDDDHDGVPNSEDDCPTQKETINGIQDDDGCPDGGPARVIREDGKLVILENVHFETGTAKLDPKSHSILNQVALVMKANPDIKHMSVEGHTDETGTHQRNMELSRERADTVRDYLVSRGVRRSRLSTKGYGPDRPLVKGNDEKSRQKNRRVEFILDQ